MPQPSLYFRRSEKNTRGWCTK